MIRISAALVAVAIALLIYGAVTFNLPFIYAAIGASVLAMILLVLGVFLQRDLLRGGGRGLAAAEGAGEPGEEPEPAAAPFTAGSGAEPPATGSPATGSAALSGRAPASARPSPQAAAGTGKPARGNGREQFPGLHEDETAGELVRVVPGRRRYHRPGCDSLAGRASEELTIDEAREEGFSACTACFPAELAADQEEPLAAEPEEPAATQAPEPEPAASAEAETAAAATEAVEPEIVEPTAGELESETPGGLEEPATPAHGMALGDAVTEAAWPTEPGAATSDGEREPGLPGLPARASGETVWVVRGVSRYHRSDCVLIRSVDEEDVDTMTQADAEAAGCTPCRACHAFDEPLAG